MFCRLLDTWNDITNGGIPESNLVFIIEQLSFQSELSISGAKPALLTIGQPTLRHLNAHVALIVLLSVGSTRHCHSRSLLDGR